MRDPHAKALLNGAAFNLGIEAKHKLAGLDPASGAIEVEQPPATGSDTAL